MDNVYDGVDVNFLSCAMKKKHRTPNMCWQGGFSRQKGRTYCISDHVSPVE